MFQVVSATIKIAIASLATGAVLQKLDLSAGEILSELGLPADNMLDAINHGVTWAVPNMILGSMVILPVWLVIYLFRPPRG